MINRGGNHRCLVCRSKYSKSSARPSPFPFSSFFHGEPSVEHSVVQYRQQYYHHYQAATSSTASFLRSSQHSINSHDLNSWISCSPVSTSPFLSSLSQQNFTTLSPEPVPVADNSPLFSKCGPQLVEATRPESHAWDNVTDLSESTSSSTLFSPSSSSTIVAVPDTEQSTNSDEVNNTISTDGSGSSLPSLPFLDEALSSIEPLLVVIDLDETLFFSHLNPQSPHDFSIHVDRQEIFVSLRPGCKEFLEWCSQNFETGLYTAGTEGYAQALMDKIDPAGRLIKRPNHRYRQSCWPVHYEVRINQKSVIQTLYTKDLSLFRKNLSRVVLIDNSLFSFMLQPDNGIPISDWRGQLSVPSSPDSTASDLQPDGKLNHNISSSTSMSTTSASGGNVILSEQYSKDEVSNPTELQPDAPVSHERIEVSQGTSPKATENQDVSNEKEIDKSENPIQENVNLKLKDILASEGGQKTHLEIPLTEPATDPSINESRKKNEPYELLEVLEKKTFGDFYLIKKTLEELRDAEDVKPILRSKYRLVDHIIRRCVSGMMTSSRM